MTTSKPPKGGPPIVCPVCGTENPATRQFCRKCAADLRAPVPVPGAVAEPVPQPIPMRPILLGGGVALAVVVGLLAVLALLGGTPAATIAPSGSAIATLAAPTASPVTPTIAPTAPATTAPSAPAPTGGGATPIPPPSIRSFQGPASVDCSDSGFNGFITLTWRVANAPGVTISIDGPGIYQQYDQARGEAVVPFGCGGEPHTYLLTTIGGSGPAATRTLVIPPAP